MFQHIVYSLANRQGLLAYVRICKTRLDTTTKFMVVVTSLFNLVILSFPDNMFYHVWTTPVSNYVQAGQLNHVQACQQPRSSWPAQPCSSLSTTMFKLASSTMHGQACQQPRSSWPAQPCSSWPAQPRSSWPAQPCSSWPVISTMFKPVNRQKQAVRCYVYKWNINATYLLQQSVLCHGNISDNLGK